VIDRELGGGGMATVYLPRDLRHHRQVALKVLRPDIAAALGAHRLLREIDIAAQLTHPHILPLHDSGEADGLLFYVMPLVEGESLRDRLSRDGALPIPDAVRVLRDKAVSDAGGSTQITSTGVSIGTPAYMAPEQCVADPNVDHRADIYSLGVIGYEMLTGRAPFAAPTVQATLAAHVTQAPVPLRNLRGETSVPLAALVMRCLEKEPAERWASAGEVVAQLEAVTSAVGPDAVSSARARQRTLVAAVVTVLLGGAWLAKNPPWILPDQAGKSGVPDLHRCRGPTLGSHRADPAGARLRPRAGRHGAGPGRRSPAAALPRPRSPRSGVVGRVLPRPLRGHQSSVQGVHRQWGVSPAGVLAGALRGRKSLAPLGSGRGPFRARGYDRRPSQPADRATRSGIRERASRLRRGLRNLPTPVRLWVRERVSYDGAYGGERVSAYLFVPKHGRPPYQTVVYFPGAIAMLIRSSRSSLEMDAIDFILKSGRAVLYPVYKSTYERGDSLVSWYAKETNRYRDHVIMWTKDFRRSIDYLETRADVDPRRLAYYGRSWGGYLAAFSRHSSRVCAQSYCTSRGCRFSAGNPRSNRSTSCHVSPSRCSC
jgi:hypothetical protein